MADPQVIEVTSSMGDPEILIVNVAERGPRGEKGDPGDGSSDISTHVNSPTPHPVYDDLPSLTLIFENGLI